MQGAQFHKILSLLTRRGALAVLFSGLLAAGVAGAGAMEDGQSAYAHRDFDAALKLLQPLAQSGDAQAQATLGLMYNTGEGVTQDFESAIRWWRLSAVQGNALAQVNLGLAYGIQQKFDRAYVHMMVDDHRSDIRDFENQSAKGTDSLIRVFASSSLQMLKRHLDSANSLVAMMGMNVKAEPMPVH